MSVNKCSILVLLLFLTACAGNRAVGDRNTETEYVEISNPGFTMTRDAPATIWVPKHSVESGVPRGGEAVKMAYESIKGGKAQNTTEAPGAAPTATAAPTFSAGMRQRIVVLETGQNHVLIPFKEKLRTLPNSPVLSIAPETPAEKLLSRDERAAYAVKAWHESGATASLFIAAPEGLSSGRHLTAEIYDGLGAGLISTLEVAVPTFNANDPNGFNAAVAAAITLLAERARDGISQLPWYAKIMAIEADRIYLNAGHDAGINMGQKLNILRGGKAVPGLGFAPGAVVGTVEISGFVGSNGSTATLKGDVRVYPTDIVSLP